MGTIEEFNQELADKNLIGFWSIVRPEAYGPKAPFEPHLWKWGEVWEALSKAGDIIGLDMSLRRFIGFKSPDLKIGTTPTLALGVQMVKPKEVAEAHHHTMGAIRFVIEGEGAQTTVNGEPFPMAKGDLITTPSLTWHDHYNEATDPIVWLDGADNPILKYLGSGLSERFSEKRQTHTRAVGTSDLERGLVRPSWLTHDAKQPPPCRYSWAETEKALKGLGETPGDPYDGVLLRYVNPVTGGSTLPTMSCEIQMLRAGERTKCHRHTSNTIYHVFQGAGFTYIDDTRYDWGQGDTFTVPLWCWHRHGNDRSGENAVLFVMNDRPIMESLDFYREERQ